MKPTNIFVFFLLLAAHGCGGSPSDQPLWDSGVVEADAPRDRDPRDEGGGLFFQRLQAGPAGEQPASASAWLVHFSDQVPAFRPILGPTVPDAGDCFAMSRRHGTYFYSGATPAAQAIGDTRQYHEHDDPLSLTGADTELALARAVDHDDPVAGMRLDVAYAASPEDGLALPRGQSYAPSSPFDELRDGLDLVNGVAIERAALYVPPDPVLLAPTDDELYPALAIDPSLDLTLTFQLDEPAPGEPALLVMLQLWSDDGELLSMCVDDHAPEVAFPAALFQQPDVPESGELRVQLVNHTLWQLDGRRFDIVAINGKRAPFQLVSGQGSSAGRAAPPGDGFARRDQRRSLYPAPGPRRIDPASGASYP